MSSSPYFHDGVPAEDSHAWANDCCFLTRLADEASERYNSVSASARNDLNNGASAAPLSCVARVVSDQDEQASHLMPRRSFLGQIVFSIKKTSKTLFHRWWHPNEVSASLVAQYAETMDLSQIPTEQIRIALNETFNTGDEVGAANLAAELARRREPASQRQSGDSNINNNNNNNSNSNSARNSRLTSRAGSVEQQQQNGRRSNRNDENVVVGSLWGHNQHQNSSSNHGWGGFYGGSDANAAGARPMWS